MEKLTGQEIQKEYMLNGKLRKYASCGGYPLFYLTHTDEILCPDCALDNIDNLSLCDANWENPDLYCDECSNRIESAYADDDE